MWTEVLCIRITGLSIVVSLLSRFRLAYVPIGKHVVFPQNLNESIHYTCSSFSLSVLRCAWKLLCMLSLYYNAERLAVSIHVPINLVSAYEITHEKVKPIHARIRLRLKRESQHARTWLATRVREIQEKTACLFHSKHWTGYSRTALCTHRVAAIPNRRVSVSSVMVKRVYFDM